MTVGSKVVQSMCTIGQPAEHLGHVSMLSCDDGQCMMSCSVQVSSAAEDAEQEA